MHEPVQVIAGCRRLSVLKKTARLISGASVFAAELVNPSRGIQHFLLAGIERMTGRTNLDTKIVSERGPGNEFVATAAGYFDFGVGGMYVGFHDRWHRWWGFARRPVRPKGAEE